MVITRVALANIASTKRFIVSKVDQVLSTSAALASASPRVQLGDTQTLFRQ